MFSIPFLSLAILSAAAIQDKTPSVEEVAKGLDSREVARTLEKLAAAGEAALPLIDDLSKRASDRDKALLSFTRDEIVLRRDIKDAYPPVRRFNLKCEDKDLVQILDELKTATGVTVVNPYAGAGRQFAGSPVTLEIIDATLMEALLQISSATQSRLMAFSGYLQMYPGAFQDSGTCLVGHYLSRVISIQKTRKMTFRRPAEKRLNVYVEFFWDPRLRPLRADSPLLVSEAVDDQGTDLRSVAAETPEPVSRKSNLGDDRRYETAVANGYAVELLCPADAAEKLALLRGSIPLAFARRVVSVTFEKPAVGATREAEGLEISIVSLPEALKQQQARIVGGAGFQMTASSGSSANEIGFQIKSGAKGFEVLNELPLLVEVTPVEGEPRQAPVVGRSLKEPLRIWCSAVSPTLGFTGERKVPTFSKIVVSVVLESSAVRVPFEFRDVKLK